MKGNSSPYIYIRDAEYGWVPADFSDDARNQKCITVKATAPKNWYVSTHRCERDKASDPFREKSSIRTIDLSLPRNLPLPSQNRLEGTDTLPTPADLSELRYLHEATVFYCLKERHYLQLPYARANDVLIAMNPFQWINGLYSQDLLREYANKLIWKKSDINVSDKTKDDIDVNTDLTRRKDIKSYVEPHVFEISCRAYHAMITTGIDQSILVSGESGSGKTETVKLLMGNLASFYTLAIDAGSSCKSDKLCREIIDKVIFSSIVLETFGNAHMVRSENSSRFSKFVQLRFSMTNASSGVGIAPAELIGSNCNTYVLEKSRVIERNSVERNFHAFYQLLAADPDYKRSIWDRLVDMDCDSFRYVGKHTKVTINGKSDAEHFKHTLKAIKLLGVTDEKIRTLFRAVCIVLQLGNIVFDRDLTDKFNEKSKVVSPAELAALSDIMEVSEFEIEECLTSRTVRVNGNITRVPLKANEASHSRDALAKAIYSNIFDYIVDTINDTTGSGGVTTTAGASGNVNLLDIFGFEGDKICHFEQLCINYANEKLQVKYTRDNFDRVHEKLAQEGIDISELTVTHQPEALQLFERPAGLISILDEECVRPTATTRSFVSKLKRLNERNKCLVRKKLAMPDEFGIRHYAGELTYSAKQFINRNKDNIPDDLINCALKSTNTIVNTYSKKLLGGGLGSKLEKNRQKGWLVSETILKSFQKRLKALMRVIEKTRPWYICCIKPNSDNIPQKTNHLETLDQLRRAGLAEVLTISRSYFQHSLLHREAISHFRCLTMGKRGRGPPVPSQTDFDSQDYCQSLFDALLPAVQQDDFVGGIENNKILFIVGTKNIHFKEESLMRLQAERKGLIAWAGAVVVRFVKMSLLLNKVKGAVFIAQEKIRQRNLMACITIQRLYRGFRSRREFLHMKRIRAAIKIQLWYRSTKCITNLFLKVISLRKIQVQVKRWFCRRKLRAMVPILIENSRKDIEMKKLLKNLQASSVPVHDGSDNHVINTDVMEVVKGSEKIIKYARAEMFHLRTNNIDLEAEKSGLVKERDEVGKKLMLEKETVKATKLEIIQLRRDLQRQAANSLKIETEKKAEERRFEKIRMEQETELKVKMKEEMEKMSKEYEKKLNLELVQQAKMKQEIGALKLEIEEVEAEYAESVNVIMETMEEEGLEDKEKFGAEYGPSEITSVGRATFEGSKEYNTPLNSPEQSESRERKGYKTSYFAPDQVKQTEKDPGKGYNIPYIAANNPEFKERKDYKVAYYAPDKAESEDRAGYRVSYDSPKRQKEIDEEKIYKAAYFARDQSEVKERTGYKDSYDMPHESESEERRGYKVPYEEKSQLELKPRKGYKIPYQAPEKSESENRMGYNVPYDSNKSVEPDTGGYNVPYEPQDKLSSQSGDYKVPYVAPDSFKPNNDDYNIPSEYTKQNEKSDQYSMPYDPPDQIKREKLDYNIPYNSEHSKTGTAGYSIPYQTSKPNEEENTKHYTPYNKPEQIKETMKYSVSNPVDKDTKNDQEIKDYKVPHAVEDVNESKGKNDYRVSHDAPDEMGSEGRKGHRMSDEGAYSTRAKDGRVSYTSSSDGHYESKPDVRNYNRPDGDGEEDRFGSVGHNVSHDVSNESKAAGSDYTIGPDGSKPSRGGVGGDDIQTSGPGEMKQERMGYKVPYEGPGDAKLDAKGYNIPHDLGEQSTRDDGGYNIPHEREISNKSGSDLDGNTSIKNVPEERRTTDGGISVPVEKEEKSLGKERKNYKVPHHLNDVVDSVGVTDRIDASDTSDIGSKKGLKKKSKVRFSLVFNLCY
mmetsp:Transcript_41917/g.98244  ORF Transcript_41917/g.98244 Transcript_41917/m.98244 type:complete len:1788 (-) Transcript_41917:606-5969(-)